MEEDITLSNACTDLVAAKRCEVFVRHLLAERAGQWVPVADLCRRLALSSDDFGPDLFACWLTDPMANGEYVVILFYEDESKWSMAAHYNRARLFTERPQNELAPPITPVLGSAITAVPAVER